MATVPLNLSQLFHGITSQILTGAAERHVRFVTADSRQVKADTLFVAIRGFHADGHHFLENALEQGASIVVVEECTPALLSRAQATGATIVQVSHSSQALALLASAYYGHPAHQLQLVGITGTNGKTTTSYIVEAILQAAGYKTGVIGTVSYRFGSRHLPAPQTTPDALELHRMFAEMLQAGTRYVIMEVSSHALVQERVWGCHFDACVFTNLSRDHYDYHGDEAAYFAAKARLFRDISSKWHVINSDDAHGRKLLQLSQNRLFTYGLDTDATLKPQDVRHGLEGIRFTLTTTKGRLSIQSPLVGRHNVYNLLAAIGVALALDVDAAAICRGIAGLTKVPGRLERVDAGQDFAVFVDYAHTPAALEQVLRLVRAETSGRLITVFGCGGDRDPGKRPLMGEVVTSMSDYTVITSDNPRTEDPDKILQDIIPGVVPQADYVTIVDRQQAIEHAITIAQPWDTVVIAGKGHEDYQILGHQRIHFDDCEVARHALQHRG